MVIVRFRGGLGNQLFQCAFCLKLKERDIEVYIDKTEYRLAPHSYTQVEDVFYVNFEMATNKEIEECADYWPPRFGGYVGNYIYTHKNNIISNRIKKNGHKPTHIYEEDFKNLDIDEIVNFLSGDNKNYYLDGYWQENKYYIGCERLCFKEEFEEKYRKEINDIQYRNSCSIHIRRGDYINSDYDILNLEYYEKAIKIIRNKYGDNITFYVFSDNIKEAEAFLNQGKDVKTLQLKFFDETIDSSARDLLLMSKCANNIIANSTYSFWAAELNSNKDKIVVAPKYFKKDRTFKTLRDEWIKL